MMSWDSPRRNSEIFRLINLRESKIEGLEN
jgi:hypothetical protein